MLLGTFTLLFYVKRNCRPKETRHSTYSHWPTDFSVTTKLGAAEKTGRFLLRSAHRDSNQALRSSSQPNNAERYKFHTREHGPSESIANYVAELKSIGGLCGFQDTLPDMLRDRLVCGVNDGRIYNVPYCRSTT